MNHDEYLARMMQLGLSVESLRDYFGIQPTTKRDWDVLMSATMRIIPNPLPPSYSGLDLFLEGFFTVAEAADHLRLHRATIYRAMERGELPYQKMGKATRIPRQALRIWAEAY